MLPLGPNPIIHYVLSHLSSNGFHDIIIIVGYLKDQLMGYLGDGSQFGVRITYVLEPDVVDYIEDEKWDFARDLFPYLMRVGEHLFGFASKSFWVDVGELKGYLEGTGWVLRRLDQDAPLDARALGNSKPRVFVSGNVRVGQRVQISGPSWFDNDAKIGDDVKIQPGTVLEEDSQIRSGTYLEQTVTFRHTAIGSNCSIKSTIIGERAIVGDNVTIDRAIIGQGCTLGDRAKILPGSRLWPNTRVEADATVDGIMAVPRDKSFYFDTGLGQYSGILVSSIGEFLKALKIVPLESVEYHIGRRDFEKWTKDVLGSIQLADNIRTLRRSQSKGEELRHQLVDFVIAWAEAVSSPQETSDQRKRSTWPLTTV